MLSGCMNFLTEFINDTCVRLSHSIRTHNPEFITLLPQLETILFPLVRHSLGDGGRQSALALAAAEHTPPPEQLAPSPSFINHQPDRHSLGDGGSSIINCFPALQR